jgi:hypothetical protein
MFELISIQIDGVRICALLSTMSFSQENKKFPNLSTKIRVKKVNEDEFELRKKKFQQNNETIQ